MRENIGLDNNGLFRFIGISVLLIFLSNPAFAENVEKWKQFRVEFTNTTWSGNPFDLEFTGTFTHKTTGRTLTQFGFYAGNNIWKIYFMPDREGEWTYTTSSTDGDLDGYTGSFDCIASNLEGQLVPFQNRWKLSDGGYESPVIFPVRAWFRETALNQGTGDFINWSKDSGALMIGTVLMLLDPPKATRSQEDRIYVDQSSGDPVTPDVDTFHLPVWDRMNDHYDRLRDKGMGHYVMLYADDKDTPPFSGGSTAELRLFRYLVARLAPYPIVMWDTGIDIGEYRNNAWLNDFVAWFKANDPWGHPVGSRSGGGSGGIDPSNSTYRSDGSTNVPSFNNMVSAWSGNNKPIAYTDHWREHSNRGSWNGIAFDSSNHRKAIRGTAWQLALTGGSAAIISARDPSNGNAYLHENYATLFDAAPDIGHRTAFFRNRVNNFGALAPDAGLVASGNAMLAANHGQEYVAYLPYGGNISIDLSSATGTLNVEWFNVITGEAIQETSRQGGKVESFSPPSQTSNDWALHIYNNASSDNIEPAAPSNLQVD